MSELAGYVYIVEDVQRGLVKIGKSVNPHSRISDVINISGITRIRQFISHRIAGYSQIEHQMHVIFDERRVRGEWFRCDFDEVKSTLVSILPTEISEADVASARKRDDDRSDMAFKTIQKKYHDTSVVDSDRHPEPIDKAINLLVQVHKFALIQQELYGDLSEFGQLKTVYEGYLDLSVALADCIAIAQEIHEKQAISSLSDNDKVSILNKMREKLK
ncbi:TPA: GIY-YIG nuclease family protein [Raoultella planticola]